MAAAQGTRFHNPRFFAAAPTRDQAKSIYWKDIKALVPSWLRAKNPSETELSIELINGSEIRIIGMDRPERIEGTPWDGGVLDEYANMKEEAWNANVVPALSDRRGWCDLIGVPEGRNHYFELDQKAQEMVALLGDKSEWGSFAWHSADILPPEEIAARKRDLPPWLFSQEYEGAFVDLNGVAIFDINKLLVNGQPVPYPSNCDAIVVVIDTALKDGKEHDGTAVEYFSWNKYHPPDMPMVTLDWDIVQIQGATMTDWLPGIMERAEQLAIQCGARQGVAGVWIEDKGSGTILLQHGQAKGWNVHAIDSLLTAQGKDARALAVSPYHYQGKCKISEVAYNKRVWFKDKLKNHLISQLDGFRIADKDSASRADDLADTHMYGLSIILGDEEGV